MKQTLLKIFKHQKKILIVFFLNIITTFSILKFVSYQFGIENFYIFSYCLFFQIFVQYLFFFPFNQWLLRVLGTDRYNKSKIIYFFYKILLISTLLITIFYFINLFIFNYDYKILYMMVLYGISSSINESFLNFLIIKKINNDALNFTLTNSIFLFLTVLVTVFIFPNIEFFLITLSLSRLIIFIYFNKNKFLFRSTSVIHEIFFIKEYFKENYYMIVASPFIYLLFNIDRLYVSALFNEDIIGIYSFYSILSFGIVSLIHNFLSKIFVPYFYDGSYSKQSIKQFLMFVTFIQGFVLLIVYLFSKNIVVIFSSNDFVDYAFLMPYFLIQGLLFSLRNFLFQLGYKIYNSNFDLKFLFYIIPTYLIILWIYKPTSIIELLVLSVILYLSILLNSYLFLQKISKK